MEELDGTRRLDGISNAVRKKRSHTSRRPRPDSQTYSDNHDQSPLSSPSDDVNKASSDENADYDSTSKRKELSLNQCISRVSSAASVESEKFHRKERRDGEFNAFYNNEPGRSGLNNKRSSEGVLAPANWKSTSVVKDGFESESRSAELSTGHNCESPSSRQSGALLGGFGNENKVKKVKLKVGGVTRTIQANSSNGIQGGESSAKSSRPSDAARLRQKHYIQVFNISLSVLVRDHGIHLQFSIQYSFLVG